MPYPTVYEPIATNKTDVTLQATDHPDHHNQLARILNTVQQQHVPDVARANLLTNGGMEIWQRGNGPYTANNSYVADQWVLAGLTSGTASVTKETAIVDTGSRASLKVAFTYGSSYIYFRQFIKSSDGYQIAGRTLGLSVSVRSTVANTVNLRAATDGTSAPDIRSARNTQANVWERLAFTVTVPADATFIVFDVEVNASCTAYLDNAMLVVGSVPADYAPMHPADDLARCQRYYEILGETANELYHSAYGLATTSDDIPISYHVRKAVTPTITKNGTWTVANCSQPVIIAIGPNSTGLRTTPSATAAFTWANTANGVTVEANP